MIKFLFKPALFLLLIIKSIWSMEHGSRAVNKLDNVHGAFASEIYEHTMDDGRAYIEKKFKDAWAFKDELEKILPLQEPLKKYMLEKSSDMPGFALYYAHGSNSITYEKAAGEALWDFLIRSATTKIDFSTTGSGFANDHIESVMKNLRKVGYSIAKFHILFQNFGDDNSFQSFIHGDMSPSNVFFKLYDGTVTFIDYSTFSYPERKDVSIDIDKFFNPYKAVGSDLKYGIMDELQKRHMYNEAEYQASLQRLQMLRRAIAKGYNTALQEASTGFKLSENDKGTFFLEKVIPKNSER